MKRFVAGLIALAVFFNYVMVSEARYYDPKAGRFISEDPIGFAGGTVNLYEYVKNNPITRIDPSGLSLAPLPPEIERLGQPDLRQAMLLYMTIFVDLVLFEGAPIAPIGGRGAGRIKTCPTAEQGVPFSSKAPIQVTPGTSALEGQYINDLGRIQPWRAYYDEYGRLVGRTDYNAGNTAAGIPDVHYHSYEWGPGRNPLETESHIPGEFKP